MGGGGGGGGRSALYPPSSIYFIMQYLMFDILTYISGPSTHQEQDKSFEVKANMQLINDINDGWLTFTFRKRW